MQMPKRSNALHSNGVLIVILSSFKLIYEHSPSVPLSSCRLVQKAKRNEMLSSFSPFTLFYFSGNGLLNISQREKAKRMRNSVCVFLLIPVPRGLNIFG